MAFEHYPKIVISDDKSITTIVRRIIEIRNDDVDQLNNLLQTTSYNTGFSKKSSSFSSDQNIGSHNLYNDIDATSGAVTLTLAASPIDGQTHYISKNDATGNNVIVSGNGKNLNGSASLSLTTQYDKLMIVYIGAANEWRVFI